VLLVDLAGCKALRDIIPPGNTQLIWKLMGLSSLAREWKIPTTPDFEPTYPIRHPKEDSIVALLQDRLILFPAARKLCRKNLH